MMESNFLHASLLGYLMPATYAFDASTTAQSMIQSMLDAFGKQVTPDLVATAKARGMSLHQVVTLASIVEREAANASERPLIAGVYQNRLDQQMLLQADPTVIYPITKGRPLGRRIRQSELHAKNGYNTYASAGLPVGPIANPGRLSIDAVLDPASTKALYFVADGTGGHVFADTLEQHNANVKKWYAIRRARGEM